MDGESTLLVPHEKPRFRGCLRRDYCSCIPARYVLAVMTCLGLTVVYGLRVNLSVAIVQMDNDTATVYNGSAKVSLSPGISIGVDSWVLSAFFYGYLISHIPGGLLAQRVGGKWVFGLGVLITAILTTLTPFAADTSVWLLVALRVMEGLSEGVTFPAMYAMWGRWAPPLEKTTLFAITIAGVHLGNIITFPLSGVLCQYGFDGGWPSVFYVFGAVGILWFFSWIFLAYSSPATHPRISRKEKKYIESSIAESTEKQLPIPWLNILTSPAVWAIVIFDFCRGWGFYTLLTGMPMYFKEALPQLQLNSQAIILSGVYSAIPYIASFIVVLGSGWFADFLRARCLSTVVVRKGFTFIAFTGGALTLLLCGYLGTSTLTAVTFLTLSIAVSELVVAGAAANTLDIAPRFAGVINGITSLGNALPGVIGPQVATAIVTQPNAPKGSRAYLDAYRDEWREVFIIAAEIYVFGALVFLILGSGEKQPWADGPQKSTKEQSTKSSETETQYGRTRSYSCQ